MNSIPAHFFLLFSRTGSWFPTPGQCVRVPYSTLLQASCDLCLCIPAVEPCRTKQLLIVTHTSAHIHAQHPDTRSPIPLSVYQSEFLALGLRAFVMLAFFAIIAFWSGHPYHCGNCRGIYWGGGSWAAVAVGTRAGGFFPRRMQKCPLSRSKIWASPRRE